MKRIENESELVVGERMRVYSGSCCMCDTGIPTGQKDMDGSPLFTGDVVQLWHGNYIGTDLEEWYPSTGLTVVIAEQYQSYSDGRVEVITDNPQPYTMGIANVGVQGDKWKVIIVKSHEDIISGERFKSYGINFQAAPIVVPIPTPEIEDQAND